MLRNSSCLALAAALLLASAWQTADAAAIPHAKQRPLYVPGRLIVKYKEGLTPAQHLATLRLLSAADEHELAGVPRLNVLKLPASADVAQAARQLEASGSVEYAEPDYYRYPTTINTSNLAQCTHSDYATRASNPTACIDPNDPEAFASVAPEWYLENRNAATLHADIGMTAAWSLLCAPSGGHCTAGLSTPATSTDFRIAIIDNGFDLKMPDLQGQFLTSSTDCTGGTCHGSAQATATDGSEDHGTMVASSMAAVGNNGEAIAGITWDAQILAIKTDLSSSAIVAGIKYAIAHNVRIINESFGGPIPSHAEYDALQDAQDHDILVVVAAGNSDADNDLAGAFYPANYSAPTVLFPHTDAAGNPLPGSTSSRPGLANVVAVGASDSTDKLTPWSQWGSFNVGLLAPGDSIIVLQRGTNDGLVNVAGTSFASPITAGSAALVGEYLQEIKSQTPDWRDIKAHVLNGSERSQTSNSVDGRSATGRLNTYLAMQDLTHGVIVVRSATIDNSTTSNDGEINPGEAANVVVTVANVGPDETDVQGTLSYVGTGHFANVTGGTVDLSSGIQSTGSTPNVADGAATMSFPVQFSNFSGNQSLLFKLHVTTTNDPAGQDRYFYLQAGQLTSGTTVSGKLTRNSQDDFQDWHVDVPAGAKNLVIWSTTPGGVDIDLIAMKNRLPQYLETLGVDNPSTDPEFQQYIEPNAQTSGRADGDESIAYDGLSNPFDPAKQPVTSAGTYHVVVVNFTGRSDQPYTLTACYAPAGTDQISFDGNYEYDEAAGSAKLTLLRSGTSGAASVKYATKDGGLDSATKSATAGTNYTAGSGTVSWKSGDDAPKTISIPLTNTGSIAEKSSNFLHFRVALSAPTGGSQLGCIKTADVAIGNPNTVIPSSGGSSGGGGGTPPPSPGKSGGGVLDLLSLLALGLTALRRRYAAG